MDKSLKLRAPEPADLDAIYLWENDKELRRQGAAVAPYSRAQIWEYINSYDADPMHSGQLRLIIDCEGLAVGTVDIYSLDRKNLHGFVGITVDGSMRRKGVALEALRQLDEYVCEALALKQLVAVVAVDNKASQGLFAKAGYKQTATLNEWIRRGANYVDAVILQKMY
jgi:diamine N-acetyltransferase